MKKSYILLGILIILFNSLVVYSKNNEEITNQSIEDALLEANKQFTYKGKPIHPGLVREFESSLADPGYPTTISVDISARHRNEYNEDDVRVEDNGYIYLQNEGEREYFYYKWLGKLNNGLHAVKAGEGGGGSGVFEDLFFIRFDLGKGYTPEGDEYNRLLMTVERKNRVGDRDDGDIQVLSDKVILGKSRYREEPIILEFKE